MPKRRAAASKRGSAGNANGRATAKRRRNKLSVPDKTRELSRRMSAQGDREMLLDTMLAVFDECHREAETDKNAARFVDHGENILL